GAIEALAQGSQAPLDDRLDFLVLAEAAGSQLDELPAPIHDLALAHPQVEPTEEGSEGARLDDPDAIAVDGLVGSLVRVGGEVHVDALELVGEHHRASEADVADQEHLLRSRLAHLGDQRGKLLWAGVGEAFAVGGRLADGDVGIGVADHADPDRKSTRLNSSHVKISYAVFCLKKKTTIAGG